MSIMVMIQSWLSPTVLFLLLNIVIGTILVTSKAFTRSPTAAAPRALERLRSVGSLYRYRSGDLPAPSNPLDDVNALHADDYCSPGGSGGGLERAPSVLERLCTVGGLYQYRSGEVPKEEAANTEQTFSAEVSRAPSALERLRSIGGLNRYLSGEFPNQEVAKKAHRSPEFPPKLARAPSVLDRLKSSLIRYTSGEFNLDQALLEPSIDNHELSIPNKKNKYDISQSETRPKQKQEAKAEAGKVKKSASAKAAAPPAEDEVDARADDFINRFRQELRLQRLNSLMQYTEMLDRSA